MRRDDLLNADLVSEIVLLGSSAAMIIMLLLVLASALAHTPPV